MVNYNDFFQVVSGKPVAGVGHMAGVLFVLKLLLKLVMSHIRYEGI